MRVSIMRAIEHYTHYYFIMNIIINHRTKTFHHRVVRVCIIDFGVGRDTRRGGGVDGTRPIAYVVILIVNKMLCTDYFGVNRIVTVRTFR